MAGPFALTGRTGNSDRLHCLNAEALTLGLTRDMPLADARAVYPDLITAPADPVREAAGLRSLRRFATRYAPQVGLDGADGLVADVTGVAHLFGGEEALREDLHAGFERMGFALQSAIAPTRGAAWALSRHGGGIIAEGGLAQALRDLPLHTLRLTHEEREDLIRLGILRIGDLMGQPRAPLARRFGTGVLQRLDQALGVLPEPVSPVADPPHFGLRLSLPEPIGRSVDVMAGLDRLLARLCDKLLQAQMGARRLRFELHRVDHVMIPLDIGLARPMRDAARIAPLFAKHVEGADAGFGIDLLRLEATQVEPLGPAQLGNAAARAEDELADLITRLGNRLGFDRILRVHPVESRLPERSHVLIPATDPAPPPVPARKGPPRPVRLFRPEPVFSVSGHPPVRFTWRRMRFTTLRATGPERIAPDWWDEHPEWETGLRDYWRIETNEGPRLWLFHTPQAPNWSVHGQFI